MISKKRNKFHSKVVKYYNFITYREDDIIKVAFGYKNFSTFEGLVRELFVVDFIDEKMR